MKLLYLWEDPCGHAQCEEDRNIFLPKRSNPFQEVFQDRLDPSMRIILKIDDPYPFLSIGSQFLQDFIKIQVHRFSIDNP
jgi:hypothetical protein